MYKILRAKARKVGTVFSEIDTNFLAVCNALLKIADTNLNLIGYADISNEPQSQSENDTYLVLVAGTIWNLSCQPYHFITWNGSSWELQSFKLTELNAAFQAFYFDAANIACIPPFGTTGTDIQTVINEIAQAVFGSSESGSGSTSI
jgi:hypothetical protein